MNQQPRLIPDYEALDLSHRDLVASHLRAAPPASSELTFTNLFIWQAHYRTRLREQDGCLLLLAHPPGQEEPFALPPLGAGDQAQAVDALMADMAQGGLTPRLCRADAALVQRLDPDRYLIIPDHDQDDYVYLVEELIALSGNRFHKKKNHLNKFLKSAPHEYRPLDRELVERVLAMQQDWCAFRDCASDESLAQEDQAIYKALKHFGELDYQGAAILVDGKVEAFSLGEPLNPDTVVIHIEKANPAINGLYAAMNQMFLARAWSGFTYVNREQDLGVEGLRAAKQSYNPHHMAEKFVISPR